MKKPTPTPTKQPKGVIIKQSEVPLLLATTYGKIFSVTFEKKDGTMRKLTGRLGVKKYLNNGHNTTAHIQKYLTVFDIKKREYRNVNTESVVELCFQNTIYMVQA
jgi:hypothetical protein